MNSLTRTQGDYIYSLEKCIKDCQSLIETQKNIPGMERCVEMCRLCIGACSDCLVACESVGDDIGKIMQNCVDACKACVEECKKMTMRNVKEANLEAKSS